MCAALKDIHFRTRILAKSVRFGQGKERFGNLWLETRNFCDIRINEATI